MATVITTVTQLLRAYNMPRTTPVVSDNPYDGRVDFGEPADPALYLSPLGTPVVADITFIGGSYTNEETGRVVTFSDVKLATVLVNVSQPKRIERTEIPGRDGTVKEYIGMDDYQVTVNGIITGPNGVYPTAEVAQLHEMCKAPISIPVVSRYLQNLGIFNLVIMDFAFDQEPGGYSKQNFTLNCISDKPVELIIQ
jgi:hypothetical protein